MNETIGEVRLEDPATASDTPIDAPLDPPATQTAPTPDADAPVAATPEPEADDLKTSVEAGIETVSDKVGGAQASAATAAAPDADAGRYADAKGYTPAFDATTRTVAYIVCGVLGAFGMLATIASVATSAPVWLTTASAVCAWLAPYTANLFGVAYNPLKMANK